MKNFTPHFCRLAALTCLPVNRQQTKKCLAKNILVCVVLLAFTVRIAKSVLHGGLSVALNRDRTVNIAAIQGYSVIPFWGQLDLQDPPSVQSKRGVIGPCWGA